MEQNTPEQNKTPAKEQELAAILKEALSSDHVAHIYANGFINAFGNADVVVLLQRNAQPVAVLNMSYTMAKSFAEKLTELIANFERQTEHDLMTTDIIDKALRKS